VKLLLCMMQYRCWLDYSFTFWLVSNWNFMF